MGHHPGDIVVQTVSNVNSAPITWILIVILAIIAYSIYWYFRKIMKNK